MVDAPTSRVTWARTHRLILSHYPPIDLFDDLADPRDWEALARAEARTNPRVYDEIGDLSLVPVERRISGLGASWVMAAFTHISPDRQSRFSDGTYGVYYAGNSFETALREHTFHMARFYKRTDEKPGWISEVRELVGAIDSDLTDIRNGEFGGVLDKDPETYAVSQGFALEQKRAGSNGIVYPSQRHETGECIAVFYPDVVTAPNQGDHFRYHWDGDTVNFVQQQTGRQVVYDLTM